MASTTPTPSPGAAATPLGGSTPSIEEEAAEKVGRVESACQNQDLTALVNLAISPHGLVSDRLRRKAWPILLGCSHNTQSLLPSWTTLPVHRDEEQVAKDVDRAFVHYPKEGQKKLDERKKELSDVIVEVLRRYPYLCYFQGFHDIVQVLYLVLGSQGAPQAAIRLSLLRIRDYMLPDIHPAIRHLDLLPEIIKSIDPELYDHLPSIPPNYALAATLTLFSHVIDEYADITRLFDFFLASDTAVPVYFFASQILSRREELLEIEKDEDEAIFMVMLGKLPRQFDLEAEIVRTTELYRKLPPRSLGWPWWRVSTSSVLKTAQTPKDVINFSLDQCQVLFRRQERELRLLKMRNRAMFRSKRLGMQIWRFRRRGAICLSILVGIYAFWLGRRNEGGAFEFMKRILGVFV